MITRFESALPATIIVSYLRNISTIPDATTTVVGKAFYSLPVPLGYEAETGYARGSHGRAHKFHCECNDDTFLRCSHV
jgi:hypothetical protein